MAQADETGNDFFSDSFNMIINQYTRTNGEIAAIHNQIEIDGYNDIEILVSEFEIVVRY